MNEDKDLKCPKKGENMAFPVQALFRLLYIYLYTSSLKDLLWAVEI